MRQRSHQKSSLFLNYTLNLSFFPRNSCVAQLTVQTATTHKAGDSYLDFKHLFTTTILK